MATDDNLAAFDDDFQRDDDDENGDPGKGLLQSLNQASAVARTNWLFFLAIMAYLAVTVAGVTHQDLLLDAPVKLPLLAVEVPLSRFFFAAPLGFLLILLGVLLQHAALADKARKLDEFLDSDEGAAPRPGRRSRRDGRKIAVRSEPPPFPTRGHPLRIRLSTYYFVQDIAGPALGHFRRLSLKAMLWSSLWLLPLLTLLSFQVTYLPFHDLALTWWHMGFVCLGIAFTSSLIAITRPAGRPLLVGPWRRRIGGIAFFSSMQFIIAFLSLSVATVPDSPQDKIMSQWDSWSLPVPLVGEEETGVRPDRRAFWLTAIFFESGVSELTRGGAWGWPRNLIVTEAFRDSSSAPRLSLRNRNFKYATFNRSVLRGADFTGANLYGAQMFETDLRNAAFGCGGTGTSMREAISASQAKSEPARGQSKGPIPWEPSDAERTDTSAAPPPDFGQCLSDEQIPAGVTDSSEEKCANLTMAYLNRADLRGSDLRKADLRHVWLGYANLRGLNLEGAAMCSAKLFGSDLRGAALDRANLLGASLFGAKLAGSSLSSTRLTFADLAFASLDFADLKNANMEGARVHSASLNFVQLSGADMRGIDLRRSHITGVPGPGAGALMFADLDETVVGPPDESWWQKLKSDLGELEKDDEHLAQRLQAKVDRAKETMTSAAETSNIATWQLLRDILVQRVGEDRTRRRIEFAHEIACSEFDLARALLHSMVGGGTEWSYGGTYYDDRIGTKQWDVPRVIEAIKNLTQEWQALNPVIFEPYPQPLPTIDGDAQQLLARFSKDDCRSGKMIREKHQGLYAKLEMEATRVREEKEEAAARAKKEVEKTKTQEPATGK